MLSLPPLVSLSFSLPQCLFLCFSISYLCSCCHLFISLCPSLFLSPLLTPPTPPPKLHQIEADSCHQAYFRHSLTLLFSHFLSVFVTFSYNFSVLLFSCILDVLFERVCVSTLDRFSKARHLSQQKIWRKTKANRETLLCCLILLSPSLVSTCPSGFLLMGGGVSHCVFPPLASVSF